MKFLGVKLFHCYSYFDNERSPPEWKREIAWIVEGLILSFFVVLAGVILGLICGWRANEIPAEA